MKTPDLNSLNPQSSSVVIGDENARFMSSVYRWMTAGLVTTGGIAYWVSESPSLRTAIFSNPLVFWALIIAQLGSVMWLSVGIKKMSASTATSVFFAYSALVGLTLSVVFMVYTRESLFSTFFLTAGSFAGLSAFGYFTKRDLGPIGSFCVMGLWGLVLFSLASAIFPSLYTSNTQIVTGIVGVIVFSGLTAYDTQKIKAMNILGNEGTEEDTKEAISGALCLYLDFINLFLSLLRLLGKRR